MARKWTEEQKKAAAARIRQNKPWEKSTGPQTIAGKKKSAQNAYKHGARSALFTQLRHVLRLHREYLKAVKRGLPPLNHDERTNNPPYDDSERL